MAEDGVPQRNVPEQTASANAPSGVPGRSSLPWWLALAVWLGIFPLIWAGGLVTTTTAGMAVPDWPGTYGWNLFLYPASSWFWGPWNLYVEHGHRLLASLVGLIAIAVVVSTWATRQRTWVRVGAMGLLALICAQGSLGGARVLLDDRTLAMLHGCLGQATFAFTTALVVLYTAPIRPRTWREVGRAVTPSGKGAMAWVAVGLALLTYGQIVVGAMLRHVPPMASPTYFAHATLMHVSVGTFLLASVVVTGLMRLASSESAAERRLGLVAAALVLVQFGLGLGTWAAKYALPWEDDALTASMVPHDDLTEGVFHRHTATQDEQAVATSGAVIVNHSFYQTTIVTAHVATGALLLASLTALALTTGAVGSSSLARSAVLPRGHGPGGDADVPPPTAKPGSEPSLARGFGRTLSRLVRVRSRGGQGFAPDRSYPMMGDRREPTNRWA